MKKLSSILMALVITQIAVAQTVSGNGQVIIKSVKTGDYDKIEVAGSFNVDLVAGKEGDITIKGEENLLEYIIAEVNGRTLILHVMKGKHIRHSMGKSIRITVPFESLEALSLSGSGDVKSLSPIKSGHFDLSLAGSGHITLEVDATNAKVLITGSGDIILKGGASAFDLEITGSGDIDATDFKTASVTSDISGSGDASIYCTESLTARISGSGDISYKGDPKHKDTKVSGSGSVSKT